MIIQYASDLHLEFPENKKFLKENPLKPDGDVLLLAGDIVPFAVMDSYAYFFNYLSDYFETTFWIPGNHEYYFSDISKKCGSFKEDIRSNVHLVNNMAILHKDVRFLFSTLWTSISQANRWQIEQRISDFRVIKYNGQLFSAENYNQQHKESLNFIKSELVAEQTYKTVVATHHVPTFLNYPEKYRGDLLNEAFAVELFDLVETYGPVGWVYGHHHTFTPGFPVGQTQMLTNQLGYVRYGEHHSFENPSKFEL